MHVDLVDHIEAWYWQFPCSVVCSAHTAHTYEHYLWLFTYGLCCCYVNVLAIVLYSLHQMYVNPGDLQWILNRTFMGVEWSLDQHTLDEGWKTQWSKQCDNNKNVNNVHNGKSSSSSQKFRQKLFLILYTLL